MDLLQESKKKKHLNINRIYYKKNPSFLCLVRFNRNVLLSIAVTLVTAQLAHLNDTLENKIIFFLDNKVMSNFLGWQCAHPQVTMQQTSWEGKFYLWRILQASQPQIISWFVPYTVPCKYSSFNKFTRKNPQRMKLTKTRIVLLGWNTQFSGNMVWSYRKIFWWWNNNDIDHNIKTLLKKTKYMDTYIDM